MPSLGEKLAQIREGAKKRLPDETRALMAKGTQELRESGILDGVVKAGASLPAFSLGNASGAPVDRDSLLSKGPLVLSVFRGSW